MSDTTSNEQQNEGESAPKMIYKRTEYVDERKRIVHYLEPVQGAGSVHDITRRTPYWGHCDHYSVIKARTPDDFNPPFEAVKKLPITFAIEAESLEEAFEKFDELARQTAQGYRQYIEEYVKKHQMPSPGSKDNSGIVDSSGDPVN